jgi:hypothetical protein
MDNVEKQRRRDRTIEERRRERDIGGKAKGKRQKST